MLSYRGVLFALHLHKGVAKGALTQDEADARLAAWRESKEAKIQAKRDSLSKGKEDAKSTALKAEKAVNEARLQALAAASAPAPVAEEAPAAPAAEEAPAAAEEAPAADAPAAESAE
jgi:small subunit ribosomal protein S16